jgi:hypothetical protein
MNMRHPLSLCFVALAVSLATGCAASTDGETEAGEPLAGAGGAGENELKSSILGEVAAVRFDGNTIVAAPSKIQRILENVGLQPGATPLEEGGHRCSAGFSFELLKQSEATAATVFICGAPGTPESKGAKGSVRVNDKSYVVTASDLDAIEAIAKEPLAVADAVFGADRVVFTKPLQNGAKVETSDAALVAKVISAMNADQIPDPNASGVRCPPVRLVSLHKGSKELAIVGLNCSDRATGIVQGTFFMREPAMSGAVTVNAGIVFGVERDLPSR